MDDAVRAGILKESDVPAEIREVIGSSPGDRLDHFIHDIVTTSMGKNDVVMSEPVEKAMMQMRNFMSMYITIPWQKARRARQRS